MQNEKQFGQSLNDDMDLFSADDLLRLQPSEGEFFAPAPPTCTLCSHTCSSATAATL